MGEREREGGVLSKHQRVLPFTQEALVALPEIIFGYHYILFLFWIFETPWDPRKTIWSVWGSK